MEIKHPAKILRAVINKEQKIPLSTDRLNNIRVLDRTDDLITFSYLNRTFQARVWHADYQNKLYKINIDGFLFEIQLEDHLDATIQTLGLSQKLIVHVDAIKAPMPGMVLKILVKEGQQIRMHEKLLILEAMKMENILQSSGEGTIRKILINQGDKVDKGQILIKLE